MRIPVFQIVQHLRLGGIEVMVLDLLRYGPHENHIIALEGTREDALKNWPVLLPFIDRIIFMNKQSGIDLRLIWRLWRIFKSRAPKAVHTHHIGPLLYGGIAAKLAGVSSIVHTEHDAWHLENAKVCRLQKLLLHLVKPHLVADAQTVADGLVRLVGASHPHVIFNGIDTQRFTSGDKIISRQSLGLELPDNALLIGAAGRLEKVKGHKFLIEALVQLSVDVHLALAGDGSLYGDLECLALRHGLEERVHFLGRVDDMPSFYRALDVFCLPSIQEGMPLSPLEAQACATPCVLSDVGGCSEALCVDSGALVESQNVKDLAKALQKQLTQEAVINPRYFVLQKCNARQMAQAYNRLYITRQHIT